MTVGVRIYPLTLAMALAQHLVRWGEEGSEGGRGFAFAVQLHREVRPESGLVGIVEHIEVNKR